MSPFNERNPIEDKDHCERPPLHWKTYWENELRPDDHAQLAEFFRVVYGAENRSNARIFEGNRSWAGARPELRIIGYDARGVAAHYGVLRRFIRLGTVDQFVAEVGLYAVRSDLEGSGISRHAAMNVVYPTLRMLKVPFGFGTVRHELRRHLERMGRHGHGRVLSGMRVRSTAPQVAFETPQMRVEDVLVAVIPIECSMDDWPAGTLIDRNGPEL